MLQRIGFRAGGTALRRDAQDDMRYTAPESFHPGAIRIAAGSALFATLLVLSARLFGL
ncbi:hypothetical protein [Methylobacterium soli]|jgi:hypothetical protein|uniref:hypothetical protein n=1 Tax=Methylobacterium soli TaxID=553447 RepID=UPI00177B869E|nr:hypothetical protein [Methylobacterium soli]GJE41379.1 hypothetical protein AEGHOMDF_0545 [Methylobacterium soli]